MRGINFLLTLFLFLFTHSEAADCDFTPTACSCSFRSIPGASCYQPVPSKPGACLPKVCEAGWKCDCFNPTHLCTRTTCTSYQTVTTSPQPNPVLTGSEVLCPQQPSVKCVSQVGQPIRPISQLSPSPSPTPSTTPSRSPTPTPSVTPSPPVYFLPCTDSSTCPPTSFCIVGKCRPQGTCDAEMDAYCATVGADGKCCAQSTICGRDYLNGDDSLCANDCDTSCRGYEPTAGWRTYCSFGISGDTVAFLAEGMFMTGWGLDACASVS